MTPTAQWIRQVDAILKNEYAISVEDAGLDVADLGKYQQSEPDPNEFVRWFSRKYDLVSTAELGLRRVR
jgi:hypothetical protein